jgi:Zn-dependent protease with chaperone function
MTSPISPTSLLNNLQDLLDLPDLHTGSTLAIPIGMTARLFSYRYVSFISALMVTVALGSASAQTVIKPDKNKYSPADDVKIGLEAAEQARRELPMLNDRAVDNYIETIGDRLVGAIPPELQHREFRYSFDVINQKEINAFALPGGPMFLNRGMIEAARSEGEIAGVMAHELAHVALRHGTAQATKAQPYQIGSIAGQILGAIVGGSAGNVISLGSQIGLGTYFLKYGREYERQADLLGAQIMARAGYDPRRMADMFRTIERQSGGGGPEWLSDHPNPGNRYAAIEKEAQMLQVRGNAEDTRAFNEVRDRLARMQPAYTAEQIARGRTRGGNTGGRDVPVRTGRVGNVEAPSTRYRNVNIGNFLRVSVPDNWEEFQNGNTVVVAPEGGFYQAGGRGNTNFTHGIEIGMIPNESHSLQQGTDELIDSFSRSNPDLRMQGNYRRENVGGRSGLTAYFTNRSATGEQEVVTVSTVQLRDGSMLYVVGVAPRDEIDTYDRIFQRARQTMQISEQRATYR